MSHKVITYLFDDYHKRRNAKLFKNGLYAYILLKCVFWTLNFDLLFGEHSLAFIKPYEVSVFKQFAFVLYYATQPWFAMLALCTLIFICSASLVKNRSYVLLDFLMYLIILNINAKTYTSTSAGDPLLANLCFLSIFLQKNFTRSTTFYGDLRVLLHNMSFIALITQMCIAYAYSSLAKWFDVDWQNGAAVHIVNMTHHYSRAFLVDNAGVLYLFSFVMSYAVLFYQTLFPVVVWFKKPKRYFLHFGVAMHLYIAFVMGLFFFGLIMALTYVLFYDFDEDHSR